jgi:hypothetical protein
MNYNLIISTHEVINMDKTKYDIKIEEALTHGFEKKSNLEFKGTKGHLKGDIFELSPVSITYYPDHIGVNFEGLGDFDITDINEFIENYEINEPNVIITGSDDVNIEFKIKITPEIANEYYKKGFTLHQGYEGEKDYDYYEHNGIPEFAIKIIEIFMINYWIHYEKLLNKVDGKRYKIN